MRLVLGILFFPLWLLSAAIRVTLSACRVLWVQLRGYPVLKLRIRGALPDRSGGFSMARLWGGGSRGPSLLEVLLALDRARRDPKLRAVLVELGPLGGGVARAEELRAALEGVRDAGKHVFVFLEQGGLLEYSVALGASRISMPESGVLQLTGVASEVLFLKGLLDKVGIRAWFGARGRYKTARETFAEPAMTPENREMTEALVGDLYEQFVAAVARNRRLSADEVRTRLDRGPFTARDAAALGFIDALEYEDEVKASLEAVAGKVRTVERARYLRLSSPVIPRRPRATVGLLEVRGHIKSGSTVPGPDGARATGSKSFGEQVRALAKDPRIDAVLLRVSSPGGSAVASDVMWHALSALRNEKPLVVSMVDVAASGGYFVSGIAETPIFASEATVTGSIGVLAGKFEASELYARLGIKKEIIGAGARAGFYSDARGFTPEESRKLEEELDAHYQHFLSRMSAGRGKSKDEIHAVAEGRVFTGRRASSNGLVDEMGGFLPALARVKALLELTETDPVALVVPHSERGMSLRTLLRGPSFEVPELLELPMALSDWFRGERAFALLPFHFRIF